MFEKQIKKELQNIYFSECEIDKQLTEIKVALHVLEKLGVNISDIEKQLDNVGIEFYKLKNMVLDKAKEVNNIWS